MADAKQILVIDDHFEVLDFLRSMLELSSRDYQVLGVPSAEEGFLELQRTPFDLLITDVRLPGMSGFELVRKVKAFRPDLPIIMITAYATTQGKQEAKELGVFRYFHKPLDTDTLLAAVHATLYEDEAAAPPEPETAPEREEDTLQPDAVGQRLQALLADTGAVEALLADSDGHVLVEVGARQFQRLEGVVQIVSQSLDNSFRLAEHLGSVNPFTIQYQAGESVDVYSANVGRDYLLILLFDAKARRGRIGTVWIFAQRAIKELKELLPGLEAGVAPAPGEDPEPLEQEQRAPDVSPPDVEPPAVEEETDAPVISPDVEQPSDTVPDAEASTLSALLQEGRVGEDVDLDAFWEEIAADEADVPGETSGLSYDEAVRRGLLPPDLDDAGE
jgi:DNA-binding response OmpR family regulator